MHHRVNSLYGYVSKGVVGTYPAFSIMLIFILKLIDTFVKFNDFW
jgi:hypothetical protein